MEYDDDLWPPFGPGAAFRQAGGGPHGAYRGRGRAGQVPGTAEWPRRPEPVRRPEQAGRPDQARRPDQGRGRGARASSLSREQIVDAAIAIADAEGADSVSMRRIAQVLQAGAMSLYWHLASKEHLLELMLDALMADVDVPEPTGDWQADLTVQARSTRAVLRRHRWVMDFIAARPPLGPNTLRNLDKSLASLDGLKLRTDVKTNVLQAVNTYVLGAVLRELQEIRIQREQEQLAQAEGDLTAKLDMWRQRLASTGRFDHFLRVMTDDVDPDAESTRDERFEFGLDCLLEGIAARIAS
jgi:AcrR family transcriptional regulator